jgi:hypothetical protein
LALYLFFPLNIRLLIDVFQLKKKDNYTIVPSPVANLKTIKNATEIEGFRQCHIRDGAALVRYFAWLEKQLKDGKEVTEAGGADVLEKYRSYVSLPSLAQVGFDALERTENKICSEGCHLLQSPRQAQTLVKFIYVHQCHAC